MAALAKDPASRPRDAFSFAASLRNLKRVLQSAERRETTENRATAPAVLAPESRPSPEAAAALSPATPATGLPHTTMQGMAPVTQAAHPTTPSAFHPTATTPEALDRMAATKTLPTDIDALPQHGTEAPMPWQAAQVVTTVEADTVPLRATSSSPPGPLNWPTERSVTRSEDPQVRSVPASGAIRAPSGAVVSAALGAVSLVVLAFVLVVVRHGNPGSSGSSEAVSRMPAPPLPDPVVALPAPTLALPAFDDVAPSAAPARSGAFAPSPTSLSSLAPSMPPTPVLTPPPPPPKKAKTPPQSSAPDRPGPGF
jgi:hypothetical protein